MLRFSHCVVPVGKVPSTGKALTGSRVALAGDDHWRGDVLHEGSGASAGTTGGMSSALVIWAGTLTSVQPGEGRVDGRVVALDDASPLLAVGLLDRVLDAPRSPRRVGSTSLSAKKQVCMTVLMRPPMPASLATCTASIT